VAALTRCRTGCMSAAPEPIRRLCHDAAAALDICRRVNPDAGRIVGTALSARVQLAREQTARYPSDLSLMTARAASSRVAPVLEEYSQSSSAIPTASTASAAMAASPGASSISNDLVSKSSPSLVAVIRARSASTRVAFRRRSAGISSLGNPCATSTKELRITRNSGPVNEARTSNSLPYLSSRQIWTANDADGRFVRMTARVALCCTVVVVACGCSRGHSSQSSKHIAAAAPVARQTTVRLGRTVSESGVTVTLRSLVLHANGTAELFVDLANHRRSSQSLELDSDRVVLTQGGMRLVGEGSGGGVSGLVLVGGAWSTGWSVSFRGFRPGLPYSLTAIVTAPDEETSAPKIKPLRFQFAFASV
jgi:hypothetical protein